MRLLNSFDRGRVRSIGRFIVSLVGGREAVKVGIRVDLDPPSAVVGGSSQDWNVRD